MKGYKNMEKQLPASGEELLSIMGKVERTNKNKTMVICGVVMVLSFILIGTCGLQPVLPVIGMAGLLLIVTALGKADQKNTFTYKKLLSYGDPLETFNQIIAEIESKDKIRISSLVITKNWIINAGGLQSHLIDGMGNVITVEWILQAIPSHIYKLSDVMWIHNKLTEHYKSYMYGVVKTKTEETFETIVNMRDGKTFTIVTDTFSPLGATEKGKHGMDVVSQIFTSRAPWVVLGYSSELHSLWNSKRDEFIASVDAKRIQQKGQ
jgi:hypothetical protein